MLIELGRFRSGVRQPVGSISFWILSQIIYQYRSKGMQFEMFIRPAFSRIESTVFIL
jgi:hypothetical protein